MHRARSLAEGTEQKGVCKMKDPKQSYYQEVAERDGEHCKACGISASERKLFLDGNSYSQTNEDPSTMMLLCLSCILLKHPTKLRELCVSEREKVKESENGSYETELHKAKVTEPRFRLLVYQMLQEAKDLMWEQGDLCNSYTGNSLLGS